jgi:hypothetical protein
MRASLISILLALGFGAQTFAMADNSLTADQLVKATQLSLQDYATVEPDMFKDISGFRVSTVGKNAQVFLDMNSGGMHMSVQYVCVPQHQMMICNQQQ